MCSVKYVYQYLSWLFVNRDAFLGVCVLAEVYVTVVIEQACVVATGIERECVVHDEVIASM